MEVQSKWTQFNSIQCQLYWHNHYSIAKALKWHSNCYTNSNKKEKKKSKSIYTHNSTKVSQGCVCVWETHCSSDCYRCSMVPRCDFSAKAQLSICSPPTDYQCWWDCRIDEHVLQKNSTFPINICIFNTFCGDNAALNCVHTFCSVGIFYIGLSWQSAYVHGVCGSVFLVVHCAQVICQIFA